MSFLSMLTGQASTMAAFKEPLTLNQFFCTLLLYILLNKLGDKTLPIVVAFLEINL